MYVCFYVPLRLSACPCIYVSTYVQLLSFCLTYMSAYLYACPFGYLSVCLACLLVCLSTCLFGCPSVCPSFLSSVRQSVSNVRLQLVRVVNTNLHRIVQALPWRWSMVKIPRGDGGIQGRSWTGQRRRENHNRRKVFNDPLCFSAHIAGFIHRNHESDPTVNCISVYIRFNMKKHR